MYKRMVHMITYASLLISWLMLVSVYGSDYERWIYGVSALIERMHVSYVILVYESICMHVMEAMLIDNFIRGFNLL